MTRLLHLCFPLLAITSTMLIGCSGGNDGRPKTVKVTGTVMYNGKVVEGATVSFHNPDSPRVASGVTDSEGKFQLTTFNANDGAVPGECKVTITKVPAGSAPDGDPTALMNDPTALAGQAQKASKEKKQKPLIPEKYGNPNTSGLKETVKEEGDNNFVFQLKD